MFFLDDLDNFATPVAQDVARTLRDQFQWLGINRMNYSVCFSARSDYFSANDVYIPHDEEYIRDKYVHTDPQGRRYQLDNMTSPNPRPNMTYVWRGHKPPALGWRYSKETMQRLHDEGRIWYPDSKEKRPRLIRYLDESLGQAATSIWTDISPVNSQAAERLNYDTQKPEALLERIIKASSNEGDLVFDCFIGSGTTTAVAEKLNRRWIACDLSRFAIHTTRKRLLGIPKVKQFVVQMGKALMTATTQADSGTELRYLEIIGNGFNALNRTSEAMFFFNRAIAIANHDHDVGTPFMAYEGKAEVLAASGKMAEAEILDAEYSR